MSFSLDSQSWATEQFAACELGDKRRTKRLIQIAQRVADNPAASFCEQHPSWSDLKPVYRLFDQSDVTFAAVAGPHWEQTKCVPRGRYLVINDTTEIDFGGRRQIEGLSEIGNGSGRGFLLHNAVLVAAESQEILGVAGQTIHYRQTCPEHETSAQRRQRDRESKIWGEVIDQVGAPGEDVQ